MCILAIQYKTVRDAPILVAHNREERLDRPSQPPRIQPGKPRVVCGTDRKAGGTWFGVNQFGLVIAALNRATPFVPHEPRSRGLLCRDLLGAKFADEAAERAAEELESGRYAGVNLLCVDNRCGRVVYGGSRVQVVELTAGLHLLSNGNLDDHHDPRQEFIRRQLTLQKLDSAVTFLAVASRAFSRKPDAFGRRGVVISNNGYGTVGSTLLCLANKTSSSIYQYAPGPPSEVAYEDYSALLRQVLSTDRERRTAEKDKDKASASGKAKAAK